jgi:hypothetical protein
MTHIRGQVLKQEIKKTEAGEDYLQLKLYSKSIKDNIIISIFEEFDKLDFLNKTIELEVYGSKNMFIPIKEGKIIISKEPLKRDCIVNNYFNELEVEEVFQKEDFYNKGTFKTFINTFDKENNMKRFEILVNIKNINKVKEQLEGKMINIKNIDISKPKKITYFRIDTLKSISLIK